MSDQTSFISQIQEEETKSAKMLKDIEADNDRRVMSASSEAEEIIAQAETHEREKAREQLMKAKEEAKKSYANLLTESDNSRRDIVEGGKTKLSKGKAHVVEAFKAMFD